MKTKPIERGLISTEALLLVAQQIFGSKSLGIPDEIAGMVAQHLLHGDLAGVESHGVIRVANYVDAVKGGFVDPKATPLVEVGKHPQFLRVDGTRCFGRQAMGSAVEQAHELAKHRGGAEVLVNTNHIGRSAPYVRMLAERGFIASMMVNAVGTPRVSCMTKGAAMGTNPIAIGIPRRNGSPLTFDATTACVAEGYVRAYHEAGEPAQEGWLCDQAGQSTTETDALYGGGGAINPMGGERYWVGANLAWMIEMMTGAMTGFMFGLEPDTPIFPGFNSVMLSVKHPEAYGLSLEEFYDRVEASVAHVQSFEPISDMVVGPDGKIFPPGYYDSANSAEAVANGYWLSMATWAKLEETAASLEVDISQYKPTEIETR